MQSAMVWDKRQRERRLVKQCAWSKIQEMLGKALRAATKNVDKVYGARRLDLRALEEARELARAAAAIFFAAFPNSTFKRVGSEAASETD
jgi:hypothetical protein